MSDDYTSQMIQWIMDQATMGQPQAIPEYDIDPEDVVKDRAARMNLYQDTLNNSFDFANSAAAGPGAFAPGAFQSQSTYTPVEQGGMQALRAYAARPNTLEGIIAQGILGGSTAAAEIAKLQQAYTEAEANGTLEGSVLEQIPMSPPDDTGVVSPDWESLGFRMGDIEEAYITEAQGGTSGALFDPTTGELVGGGNRQYLLDDNGQPVLVDVDTQMSEAAQRFADQGLSLPTDQFQMEDLIDPGLIDTYSQMPGMAQQNMQAYEDWLQSNAPAPPPTAKDMLMGGQQPTWAKPGGPQAATPPSGDAGVAGGGLSPNSARGRLQTVGNAVAPYGQDVYNILQDVFTGQQGAQGAGAASGNIGIYGTPEENPVSTAINSGTMSLLDWIMGHPGDRPGEADPRVAGGQLNSPGGLLDPFAGMSDEEQLAAVAANPNLQTPAWQNILQQGGGSGGGGGWSPADLGRFFGGGVGNTGPGGVGGGGAGGVGGPRTAADLIDIDQSQGQPGVPPGGYVHNGAIFDAQGHLVGYVNQPPPSNPMDVLGLAGFAPNTSTRTGPEPSDPMGALGLAGFAPNTSTRTGPEPSDPMGALGLAGFAPNTSTRTGPEPSDTIAILGHLLGIQQPATSPASRTNATATSAGGRPDPNSPSARTNATATSPVRIGQASSKKKTKDTRTNTPSGRTPPRGVSMKAQHTPSAESRRLGEQYIQGYHDREAAARAAGIGTGAYGRAAAAAYLLAQQGITPLSTQQAARRAASGAYGV
jgi:hypothetical protein